jgi:hypothetical protein
MGLLEWFMIAQVLCPALLYLPGTQPIRVPLRVAPFALSAAIWGWWLVRGTMRARVVAGPLLVTIVAYLILMIFMPTTNTWMAGVAQVALYASVLMPVFWAPSYVLSQQQVTRVLAILLTCCGINSVVGIMQVYDPGHWLPKEFSSIALDSPNGLAVYEGPTGEMIVRPPGLGDNPGAVCGPAMSAALLGLIFATGRVSFGARIAASMMAVAGIAAIFLSHVRTSILIVAGTVVVYCAILAIQHNWKRSITTAVCALFAFLAAVAMAAHLGGEAVLDRFATLFEADPQTVYYQSARGYQLQYDTMHYLEDWPIGAGLGRWGMMRHYFGDEDNDRSPMIWAEIQWPAWVLDGGIVLLVLYNLALILETMQEYRICRRHHDPTVRANGAIIFAVNAGAIALVFGFTPFTTQVGMQYWFLAGVLHGSAMLHRGARPQAMSA